jgi:hypothetical protein
MKLLGVITVLTTATKNNKDTAVPFALPAVGKIAMQSDTAGVFAELGLADNFTTDENKGRRLGQYEWAEMQMGLGVAPVLSVKNPTGGTAVIKVWGLF